MGLAAKACYPSPIPPVTPPSQRCQELHAEPLDYHHNRQQKKKKKVKAGKQKDHSWIPLPFSSLSSKVSVRGQSGDFVPYN